MRSQVVSAHPPDTAFSGLRRSADFNTALFWLLLIIQLIPLWSFRYVPTTDGPSHVYNAIIMRDYNRPDREVYREFFVRNHRPVPNWMTPLTLSGLCSVVSPLIAEKVLLSSYLIGFMLAVRWALSATRRSGARLAIAAFPMAANFCFYEGLYSFYFGCVLYFVVIGYWIREEQRPAVRKTVALAALLVLLYAAHPIPLVMAYLFFGGAIAWRAWVARSDVEELRMVKQSFWRNCLAASPSLLLFLIFLMTEHSSRAAEEFMRHPHDWSYRLRNLLSWMKSYQSDEFGPASAVLGLFAAVTGWLLWRRLRSSRGHPGTMRSFDAVFFVVALYLAVFLAAPGSLANGILIRLAGFPFFALLIGWAAVPLSGARRRRLENIVAIVSSLAFVWMVGLHVRASARLSPYFHEIENAESHIPAGATMLPIEAADGADIDSRGRRLSRGVSPLTETAAYFAGQHGILDLDNYEAALDYFPLRFRPSLDPSVYIMDRGWDFTDYQARTGHTVDYVLLWTGGVQNQDPISRSIQRQLNSGYDLVFVSKYSHYARLYRRRRSDSTTRVSVTAAR